MVRRIIPVVNSVLGGLPSFQGFAVGMANPNDTLLLDQWVGTNENYWRRIASKISHSTTNGVISIYWNGSLYGCFAIRSKRQDLIIDRLDLRPGLSPLDLLKIFSIATGLMEVTVIQVGNYNRIVLSNVIQINWPHCKALGFSCLQNGGCLNGCGCTSPYMTFYL